MWSFGPLLLLPRWQGPAFVAEDCELQRSIELIEILDVAEDHGFVLSNATATNQKCNLILEVEKKELERERGRPPKRSQAGSLSLIVTPLASDKPGFFSMK